MQPYVKRQRLQRLAPLIAAGALAAAPVGSARAGSLTAQYDISLIGLKIGVATVKGDFDAERYKLEIWAKLTGLAGMVTGGKGAAAATGTFGGNRPLPASFAVSTASAETKITVRMALAAGTVQALDLSPPLEDRPDRIPVTDGHKRGVVDPVSALLMPVAGSGTPADPGACNRTIPVFDGAARFDVTLSYERTEVVRGKAYDGPAVVCSARYKPIAGHRANRRTTQYMEDNRDMEAWLVPVDGGRFFVPYRISVKTMIGTTVIEASRLAGGGLGKGDDGKGDLNRPVRAKN